MCVRVTLTIHEQLLAAIAGERRLEAGDRLCQACVQLLDVDAAAISLVFDGANAATVGASGPQAQVFDELQFILGEGPCLDSVALRAPVQVVDLADPHDVRWPAYGAAMREHQIRGVYAMPVLVAGEWVGALDLFCAQPGALRAEQLAGAVAAAELAAIPVLDLMSADLKDALFDPSSTAWAELNTLSRAEVSQATGMLMGQLGIDAAEALVRLRAHAYATDRSAIDVARDILDRRLMLEDD